MVETTKVKFEFACLSHGNRYCTEDNPTYIIAFSDREDKLPPEIENALKEHFDHSNICFKVGGISMQINKYLP